MKTFKAAKWDSDPVFDNTYQELFKASKKGKRTIDKTNILRGKVTKDGKQKYEQQTLLKKYYNTQATGDNLITIRNIESSSQKKIIKKLQDESKNNKYKDSIEHEWKQKKKLKKHKAKFKNSDDSDEDGTSKKEKKMLKKYASEISILNTNSDKLNSELIREKKKQRKLKKKLEKAAQKQILLSKVIESKLDNKYDEEPQKIKRNKHTLDDNKTCANSNGSNGYTKDKKKKHSVTEDTSISKIQIDKQIPKYLELKRRKNLHDKLKAILSQVDTKKVVPVLTLRQKMMEKLKAARFRFLNEQIYTTDSKEAQKIFKTDPEAFNAYHEGYRQQVKSWPLNPLDVIIKSIRKMPKNHVIADFGCGDAKLAKSVDQRVHSFDLVAVDDSVVACDMSRVPLQDSSVDVAVFCLSLMGVNLHDYLIEANRVLKIGGILKIAEVESRFDNVENFVEGVQCFGFKKTWKDLSNNLFYFLDFRKERGIKSKKKLPTLSLLPCMYKKR